MANLEIKQCLLTNNDCYKQGKKITPAGIVVHSTGANNPKLSRYVQPDDGILGDNNYNNDWNQSGVKACVHAFIGKDKNGKVRVYQTLPWDYRCWGCGSGSKGSYNNNFIQFEICEDGLTDRTYFTEAFNLAIELCAYLAKKYNISTNNIVSHKEAHSLGYATNHADCDHWLDKYNKNMDWFRTEVMNKINGKTSTTTTTPSRDYLMKGDKGEAVKTMQSNLIYIGYSCGSAGADGDFGEGTKQAVIKFQKANKLTADGLYGAKSKAKLEELVAAKKKAESNATVTPNTPPKTTSSAYTQKQFIKDVQSCINAKVDGIAGQETLSKTVTVSRYKNNRHKVVKYIQKYLNTLGYNCGTEDGVAGAKFETAVRAYQKANGCVADSEITTRGMTWKKLLGLA